MSKWIYLTEKQDIAMDRYFNVDSTTGQERFKWKEVGKVHRRRYHDRGGTTIEWRYIRNTRQARRLITRAVLDVNGRL